jgi:hypothetical protein
MNDHEEKEAQRLFESKGFRWDGSREAYFHRHLRKWFSRRFSNISLIQLHVLLDEPSRDGEFWFYFADIPSAEDFDQLVSNYQLNGSQPVPKAYPRS